MLINDGSTDQSESIAKEYELYYENNWNTATTNKIKFEDAKNESKSLIDKIKSILEELCSTYIWVKH